MMSGGFDFVGDVFGGVTDFIFGEGGTAPAPFRNPGWERQGNLLDQMVTGSNMSSGQLDRMRQFLNTQEATFAPGGSNFGDDRMRQQQEALREQIRQFESNPFTGSQPSFTPGQSIAGTGMPQQTTFANQPDITTSFGQRNPFQFNYAQGYTPTQFNAQQAVGDAFTPQYQMAQRLTERQGEQERGGILEDLNRRGLYTGGTTTRALMEQRKGEGDRLANLADQLAAQQGQQRLGAEQFGAQLGAQQGQFGANLRAQQQQNQAEEMFRQQGASDQQAQYLANLAMQNRQQQLGAQGQAYGQQLTNRQQAMNEYNLGQGYSRLPLEDLFRLYGFSTGAQQGQAGTPGLLGSLLGGAGQGVGMGIGGAMAPKLLGAFA